MLRTPGKSATLFDDLLPAAAFIVEALPHMWDLGLLPEEQALVARGRLKRVREFTAGRNCARAALLLAGYRAGPILMREDRSPVFPDGTTGSITHTDDYCAAAVMKTGALRSIGIDAEPNLPLPGDILGLVAVEVERQMLEQLPTTSPIQWSRLLFSAKEGFYKAYFQVVGEFLDFTSVQISIDPCRAEFAILPSDARFQMRMRRGELRGKYSVREGRILTAIAI